MLVQLHWEFEGGKTEMRAQKEISSNKEMTEWKNDIAKRHPLPENAIGWFVCEKGAKHFWVTPYNPNAKRKTNVESAD